MATKIKYNVKGVDSSGGDKPEQAKPGMYQAEIVEINERDSKSGNGAMLEVVFKIVSDSKGKKKNIAGINSKVWHYVMLEHEPSAFRLREFLEAIGKVKGKKGETGSLDIDSLIGTVLQVQLKSDRDQDGDYRPKVGKVLELAADAGDDEEEPDEDDEPDEDEEPEEDDADDEEEDDEDAVDLSELDRKQLKAFIKEEELDIKVTKPMSDDDIRDAIAEALGGDEEEEEEEEPEEDEDDGLDDLDRAGLKKHIKSNDLEVKVTKSMSEDDIREAIRALAGDDDDEEEEEDEAPDYSTWDVAQLNAELKERGLPVKGNKSAKVKALAKDDSTDDGDPF